MIIRPIAARHSLGITRSVRLAAIMPLRAKLPDQLRSQSTTSAMTAAVAPTSSTEDDVLFHSKLGVRTIQLNRPKKFNSLNESMAKKILDRLQEYEKSQLANVIVIKANHPKAFCAGGDVGTLAEQNKTGGRQGQQASQDFFGLEYKLDHYIATYDKPYVAFMDGITMGGGVGLSVHGHFRIATEKTVFAMPETIIGFFPDVGASFFLPRLDGEIGAYLALTSERLVGAQTVLAGIATHYVHSTNLPNLEARLSELNFNDHAPLKERLEDVRDAINEFTTTFPQENQTPLLGGAVREAIDRCFQYDTVDEIVEALKEEDTDWAQKTIETLKERSPISLRVALRCVREGAVWNITETFLNEYHIAGKFMNHELHPDFVEGVEKQLSKTKPKPKPVWKPATLEETSEEMVEKYFDISEDEKRLELLNKRTAWNEYPHAWTALPSEAEIQAEILTENLTESNIRSHLLHIYEGYGVGLEHKIEDIIDRKVEFDEEDGSAMWIDDKTALPFEDV